LAGFLLPASVLDAMPPEPSPAPAPCCENCGAPLSGPWCARCGQRDFDFRRPFREVASEWLGGVFNFDGKWARDIPALLFAPGRLTAEFWAGRRAAHVPPIRSYLFVSLLFFLWLGLSATGPAVSIDLSGTPLDPDGVDVAVAVGTADFDARMREWLPRIFVLGLPVLAGLSRLLYRRREFLFLHHLVFALHLQSFVFLWLMTVAGWMGLLGFVSVRVAQFVEPAAVLYVLAYPALAFRRCFGDRWSAALLRSFVFLAGYLAFLAVGVVSTVVLLLALG
jgi:hypothetical protein